MHLPDPCGMDKALILPAASVGCGPIPDASLPNHSLQLKGTDLPSVLTFLRGSMCLLTGLCGGRNLISV